MMNLTSQSSTKDRITLEVYEYIIDSGRKSNFSFFKKVLNFSLLSITSTLPKHFSCHRWTRKSFAIANVVRLYFCLAFNCMEEASGSRNCFNILAYSNSIYSYLLGWYIFIKIHWKSNEDMERDYQITIFFLSNNDTVLNNFILIITVLLMFDI